MQIIVNDRQKLLTPHAKDKAIARATASFAKFGDHVKSIDIAVQDANGPRGGIDKDCRVLVNLTNMNDIATTARDESLSKAIASSISRSARTVARTINRRTMRRGSGVSSFGFN